MQKILFLLCLLVSFKYCHSTEIEEMKTIAKEQGNLKAHTWNSMDEESHNKGKNTLSDLKHKIEEEKMSITSGGNHFMLKMQEVTKNLEKLKTFSKEIEEKSPESVEKKTHKTLVDFVDSLCRSYSKENIAFKISGLDYLKTLKNLLLQDEFSHEPDINPSWMSLWQTVIFQIIDTLYTYKVINSDIHSEFFEDEEILRKLGIFFSYYSHMRSWNGDSTFTPIGTYEQIVGSLEWFYLHNAIKGLSMRKRGIFISHLLYQEMVQFCSKSSASHSTSWQKLNKRLNSSVFFNILDSPEERNYLQDDAKYFMKCILDLKYHKWDEEDMELEDTIAKFSFCALTFIKNYVSSGMIQKIISSEDKFNHHELTWNPFFNKPTPLIMILNPIVKLFLRMKNLFRVGKNNWDLFKTKWEMIEYEMELNSFEVFAKSYAIYIENSLDIHAEQKEFLFSNYVEKYLEIRNEMKSKWNTEANESFRIHDWVISQENLKIYITKENLNDCSKFQKIKNIEINLKKEIEN